MDIEEEYGIGSYFKSIAEARSLNSRVPELVNSAINLWINIERAKGTHPRLSMLEHYSDVVLMLETILQFSRPL